MSIAHERRLWRLFKMPPSELGRPPVGKQGCGYSGFRDVADRRYRMRPPAGRPRYEARGQPVPPSLVLKGFVGQALDDAPNDFPFDWKKMAVPLS
jgi:hypothetical protein